MNWLATQFITWRSRLESLYWERKLGIRTRGYFDSGIPGSVYYSPTGYPVIRRVLNQLGVSPDDVLVDIGCGAGRVLCAAWAWYRCCVIGVEIVPHLADQARKNLQRLDAHHLVCSESATTHDYGAATVLILYHPFNGTILNQTLEQVERTAKAPLRVGYIQCLHDDVFRTRGWKCTARWPRKWGVEPVSFWEWRP